MIEEELPYGRKEAQKLMADRETSAAFKSEFGDAFASRSADPVRTLAT